MVTNALDRLRRHPEVAARSQVPILGRCIDLAFARSTRLTTVEFKLSDWRRALLQARDHQLVADYAYICLPRRRVTGALRSALEESGVGLFFYDPDGSWPFEVIIRARRSLDIWPVARRSLRRRLRQGGDM